MIHQFGVADPIFWVQRPEKSHHKVASHAHWCLCRYLLSLVDDSPTVRAMAEHLVVDAMRKAPSLAHNHFLEAAFVLNNAKAAWLAIRRRGGGGGGGGGSQALSIASSGQLPRALQLQLAAPTADAQSRRFVIYKVCRPVAARCAD